MTINAFGGGNSHIVSGPWGTLADDDRRYPANLFRVRIGFLAPTAGIVRSEGDACEVTPTTPPSRHVEIGSGSGFIGANTDSMIEFEITSPFSTAVSPVTGIGLSRIDRIGLLVRTQDASGANDTKRGVDVHVIEGTAAAVPVAPVIDVDQNESEFFLELAQVTSDMSVTLLASNIEDTRTLLGGLNLVQDFENDPNSIPSSASVYNLSIQRLFHLNSTQALPNPDFSNPGDKCIVAPNAAVALGTLGTYDPTTDHDFYNMCVLNNDTHHRIYYASRALNNAVDVYWVDIDDPTSSGTFPISIGSQEDIHMMDIIDDKLAIQTRGDQTGADRPFFRYYDPEDGTHLTGDDIVGLAGTIDYGSQNSQYIQFYGGAYAKGNLEGNYFANTRGRNNSFYLRDASDGDIVDTHTSYDFPENSDPRVAVSESRIYAFLSHTSAVPGNDTIRIWEVGFEYERIGQRIFLDSYEILSIAFENGILYTLTEDDIRMYIPSHITPSWVFHETAGWIPA